MPSELTLSRQWIHPIRLCRLLISAGQVIEMLLRTLGREDKGIRGTMENFGNEGKRCEHADLGEKTQSSIWNFLDMGLVHEEDGAASAPSGLPCSTQVH